MNSMTDLMQKAIQQLQSLPDEKQDELARFLLNELQEDDRWGQSTQMHSEKLQNFITQVLADDSKGMCEPLNPDNL